MTPEKRVAAYLTDCYQRKLRWNQLQAMERGFMHGWSEIEQLGHEIGAAHWVHSKEWPGAASCGWGSDDEKESEYFRAYETARISDEIVEVIVECRHGARVKNKIVYRVRWEEDEWRIENEFEVGIEQPTWEHCESPGVKKICTAPRPLNLGTICPIAAGQMKPTIRLHAVRDDTVTAFDSHMSGPFLANDPATWPRCECHQTPLIGGFQLWRRDLVAHPLEVRSDFSLNSINHIGDAVGMEFPTGTDVLQIFWCPFYHPYEQSAHYLRWLDSRAVNEVSPSNPAYRQPPLFEGMVPKPCRLHPEPYVDYPALWEACQLDWWPDVCRALQASLEERPAAMFGQEYGSQMLEESINGFYSEALGAVDGTKWSGHPHWIQDPQVPTCECGTPMQHLLTVASSCDHTVGPMPVTIESSLPAKWDDNLCMGDAGSVYYFLCPQCPGGTRYQAVFQCS